MNRANVHVAECEYDGESSPAGYRCGVAHVGQALSAQTLAVKVYEMPPGQSVCPYHYEYEEEWLLVLAGTICVRTPEGEQEIQDGDLVCFPRGPAGAHKATNRGETTARIMMFSSAREPAVAVYPDSKKLGVWPGNEEDNMMVRREEGKVDYWDGES